MPELLTSRRVRRPAPWVAPRALGAVALVIGAVLLAGCAVGAKAGTGAADEAGGATAACAEAAAQLRERARQRQLLADEQANEARVRRAAAAGSERAAAGKLTAIADRRRIIRERIAALDARIAARCAEPWTGDAAQPDQADQAQPVAAEAAPDADVGAGRVSCPDVVGALPATIPAEAAGDVERELLTLARQLQEADRRLAGSQGQGGPAFVGNAILGPLRDQRRAALERIEIAIGRHGERPAGLVDLAACTLA